MIIVMCIFPFYYIAMVYMQWVEILFGFMYPESIDQEFRPLILNLAISISPSYWPTSHKLRIWIFFFNSPNLLILYSEHRNPKRILVRMHCYICRSYESLRPVTIDQSAWDKVEGRSPTPTCFTTREENVEILMMLFMFMTQKN